MNVTWSHIRININAKLPEAACRVWLDPLHGELQYQEGSGTLRLTAATDFAAAWVQNHYCEQITEAAFEVLGFNPKLEILAKEKKTEAKMPQAMTMADLARHLPTAPALLASGQQLSLPNTTSSSTALDRLAASRVMVPEWKYSFEDFIIGPCNQLAHAAANSMLQARHPVDMLFLCSASGLGKTHLTQAVGLALLKEARQNQSKVAYLTAEEFTSQFIQASRLGQMDSFKERFRNLDMLLLEDIHFLKGKDKTQEELLATIKSLQTRGGRVVFTSSFAPRELAGVDSHLVSRFCSGFVAALDKPCHDTRMKILMAKAKHWQVKLPESVADYLAERVTTDVRLLESCLHNMVLKANLLGQPISQNMAMDIIQSVAEQNQSLKLSVILDLVCRSFNLTLSQLASQSRRQELVQARNTAFYLLRKHSDLTLEEIGQRFHRKHSTVIKGITSVEREMSRESSLGRQFGATIQLIEKNARAI